MNEASLSNEKQSKKEEPPYFYNSTDTFGINFNHEENKFDDYQYQVLLPHKLSQMGPALAKADVNKDGLEDVYLGGASGFSPKLYVQKSDGSFYLSNSSYWAKESTYEDVDALFVDVNGDGHQDLYVVSGGNEYPANDLNYRDRIYFNDGKGNFSKGSIKNINPLSGSVVKASDYDNDGDMDLFVGGRHVPHQYPLPASSMLLINENGNLVNKTQNLAIEFENIGMVTDAIWNDYDADGDLDLTLVGEWMPVTFFNNQGLTSWILNRMEKRRTLMITPLLLSIMTMVFEVTLS